MKETIVLKPGKKYWFGKEFREPTAEEIGKKMTFCFYRDGIAVYKSSK